MKVFVVTVINFDDNYKNIDDDRYTKVFASRKRAYDYAKQTIYDCMKGGERIEVDFEDFDLEDALEGESNYAQYREKAYDYEITSHDVKKE